MNKVSEIKNIPLSEILNLCAWKGCDKTCPIGALPPGWTAMLIHWSNDPILNVLEIPTLRDSVLCPEHTQLLDSLLKDLHRELKAPAVGSA